MTNKKVVESKNNINKSCPKFCILGDNFSLFGRNFKNEDSRAKKRFFVGSKKEVKKVIKSKNDFSKSIPKFCKLGDGVFLFDEISKMRLLQLKNDILIILLFIRFLSEN